MSLCSQAQVVTDLSKSSPVAMPQDESVELYLPTNDYQKQELGDRTVYVKKVKPMAGTTATVTFNYVIKDPNLASPMSLTIYNPEQKVIAVDTKGASNTVTASIPVGKYDMHAMFKGKPVGNYIVFKENVEINGDTTLNFDMSEATEPIRFKAYDDNGTLFNLDEYENGAVAVEKFKASPKAFDLILMDIQMPVMNGYEATKAIRGMYPKADLPIIALSANAFEEDKRKSVEAGMNAHIAKPIVTEELFKVLNDYLAQKRQ